jgi:tetratricopeptide (TPR) repeat protein
MLAQKKPEEAVAPLRKAVAGRPESQEARYYLGLAFLQTGRRQEAESEWTQAADRGGDFFQVYLALGQLKLDANDPDAAIRLAQQALRIAPQASNAHLIAGAAYGLKRDFGQAAAELEQFVRINPNNPAGLLRLGITYSNQGKTREAEEAFEAALSADPQHTDSLTALAGLYVSQKRPAQAIQRVNQQIARAPQNAGMHALLADVYLSLKNHAKAEEEFQKAVSQRPKKNFRKQYL